MGLSWSCGPAAKVVEEDAVEAENDDVASLGYTDESSDADPKANGPMTSPHSVRREDRRVCTLSNAQIAASLNSARQERVRLFRRVRCPCLVVCAGLIAGSFSLSTRLGDTLNTEKWFAGDCMLSLALVCLLLAMLPADRWFPRVGSLLIGLRCCRGIQVNISLMVGLLRGASCHLRNLPQVPCFVRNLQVAPYVWCSIVWTSAALYVLWAVRLPPRRNLSRLWRAIGVLNVARSTVSFARLLCLGLEKAVFVPDIHVTTTEFAVWWASALYHLGLGLLVLSPYVRRRVQWCVQARNGDMTAATSIAAYIGGEDAENIMQRARNSCRCVTLDLVTREDMEKSTPDASLQRFVTECRFEEIDAFLSHSWHDPPEMKWQALQVWRQAFKAKHRREPAVWIDKYCIDQKDIQASLMCLPVFLAGCHTLLILAGPTYLSRLWCVEELFIFLQMSRCVEAVDLRILSPEVADLISNFTVRDARCHLASDEETLRAAIEAGCSDLNAFDVQVRDALRRACGAHLA